MLVLAKALSSISICMIFTAFLIVEARGLRASAYAYIAQSSLLVGVFLSIAYLGGEKHFYIWSATATITKVILVPYMVLWTIGRVEAEVEEPPLLPRPVSAILDFILVIIGFIVASRLPIPAGVTSLRVCLGVSMSLLLMGVWGMVGRRCALKQTICLCHMENGVHLLLATLAYKSPVTVEIGILTDAVLAIALMLYLSCKVKEMTGSLDVYRLSSMRW